MRSVRCKETIKHKFKIVLWVFFYGKIKREKNTNTIVITFRLSSVVRRPSVNISHFNLLLRNHWANCNQTLVEWSLDSPLPNLCPVIPISNQDGRQAYIPCFSVKFFFQPIYTDYANYAYFDKRSHLNLLLWNRWTKLNQTWQGLSLGGSLSKLCPTAPPFIQDGRCY